MSMAGVACMRSWRVAMVGKMLKDVGMVICKSVVLLFFTLFDCFLGESIVTFSHFFPVT